MYIFQNSEHTIFRLPSHVFQVILYFSCSESCNHY